MCSEAHQRDPRNTNVLRDRAEAYILNQDYEKGEGASLIGQRKPPTVLKLWKSSQQPCSNLHFEPPCLSTAVEDYQEAREFDDNQEIREGLERAQKMLKISRKRDYYKILGVGRYPVPHSSSTSRASEMPLPIPPFLSSFIHPPEMQTSRRS